MICSRCGKIIPNHCRNTKYCDLCKIIVKREAQRRYKQIHKKGSNLPPALIVPCQLCGKDFQPHNSQLYCDQCRADIKTNGFTKPKTVVHHPPPAKHSKSLEQWVAEANACNLDYGSYRALINQGKSFDELKASACLRRLPTHSHSSQSLH